MARVRTFKVDPFETGEREQPMSTTRHVVAQDDGSWAVRKPGAERLTSRHDGHEEAMNRAREIVADAGGGQVIAHGRDGKIERVEDVDERVGDDAHGSADTPPRDEDGKFVAEGSRSGGGGNGGDTPPRDEDGKFVAEGSRSDDGGNGGDTPPRDEDGRFVAEGSRSGDGGNGGDTPPRDEDGKFVADGSPSKNGGARLPDDVPRTSGRGADLESGGRPRVEGSRTEGDRDEPPFAGEPLGADAGRARPDAAGRPGVGGANAAVRGESSEAAVGGVRPVGERARPAGLGGESHLEAVERLLDDESRPDDDDRSSRPSAESRLDEDERPSADPDTGMPKLPLP